MIVTVFRNRLIPGAQEEYVPMAKQMSEQARAVPGLEFHSRRWRACDNRRVRIGGSLA